jgi:hypothetical protein
MQLVRKRDDLFGQIEEIDLENDEYIFWDANGEGVSVRSNRDNVAIEHSEAAKPLAEAFSDYARSLGLSVDVVGMPIEVWGRIQDEVRKRPKGLFAKLLSIRRRQKGAS